MLFKSSKGVENHQCSNLNIKNVTVNKRFWKTAGIFYTKKSKANNIIILTKNGNKEILAIKFAKSLTNACKRLKEPEVSTSGQISIF